jgi:carboxynorspermidine decarboxylase
LAAFPATTPAFVFNLDGIAAAAERVALVGQYVGCRTLYAVKALALPEVVRAVASWVDGLAVSSLTETRLGRAILDEASDDRSRTLQLTTPGIREDEIDELAATCDVLVFNSLPQWQRFGPVAAAAGCACALRVNPQLSWLDDDRYDPCRPYSHLGVPLAQLAEAWQTSARDLHRIRGLHFHTNYRSTTTDAIEATVVHIAAAAAPLLERVEWLNIGGGYELADMDEVALTPLARTAAWLRNRFGTETIIEPGGTLVRPHGWLVASVIDLFESDGQPIAVLDTSVAHLAEVFEYQRSPKVLGHTPQGSHRYTLAGCSCLAGDRFGEYRFERPLAIGQRIVYADAGAYALSKVQQFNGIAPPAVLLK